VCSNNADVILSGNVWGGGTTGTWTTNGDGAFSPSSSDLNATYIPGVQDITDGIVVMILTSDTVNTCFPVLDTMLITINPPPVVNAGATLYVCNDENAHLHGIVTGGSGTGQWTTDGDGTFMPDDETLNGTYVPGTNDIAGGLVTLTLISTNNGGCLAVSNDVILHITTHPTVLAGSDMTICSDETVSLNGSVSGSTTTGFWTSTGGGVFVPDSSALNAVYVPDPTELANGSFNLYLTSSFACAVSDTLTVSVIPAPVADAGNNQVVCQGVMTVNLSGSVNNAVGGYYWLTDGTGTFVPDNTTLNATYLLSSQDSLNGTFILTLVAVGDALCGSNSDSMTVVTAGSILVDAGSDVIVCASGDVFLNGSANAGNIYWTTTGTGAFSPDSSDVLAQYLYSPDDTTAGSVEFILNSQTSCGLYSDTLLLSFTPVPFVDAGTDFSVCKNSEFIQLSGMISQGSITGQWTTSGTGIFMPNDSSLVPEYYLTSIDTALSGIAFWLTSTNNGTCVPMTDSVYVTFEPSPIVFAGDDHNVCVGNNVALDGQIIGATGTGGWTSNGDGTFNPSSTDLVTSYIPGTNDLINETVILTLTSDLSAYCASVSDSIIITFISLGTAADIAFADSLCFGDSLFVIPVITGDTGAFAWTTSGSGACGSSRDSLLLNVNPIPFADFSFATICNELLVNFTDQSRVNPGTISSYEWDFGDGGTSDLQDPSHTYLNPLTVDVGLIVSSAAGCSDTVLKPVQVFNPVFADFVASDTTPGVSEQVNFTNQSTGGLSYMWTFGDQVGTSVEENPSYAYSAPGVYPVWLFVEGENSCMDSATVNIFINFAGYAVPTAFSPNGDGLNDGFNIRGGPFVEYEMRVFNDWGQEIFISTSQSVSWDGTFKGKDQQEGVYVLIFRGKLIDGTEVDFSGDITLVR
jgi:gliding motility-associated-like protein